MSFPLPPLVNKQPPCPFPTMEEPTSTGAGHVNSDETSFILTSCLIPKHHENPKVLKFIDSYLHCRDISQASKESGYTYHQGRTLRSKPDIHLAITKMTEKSVMKYGFDGSEVVERVKEISSIDPIEFENADGTYKTHLSQIRPEARRAIKKFKVKNLMGKDLNGMQTCIGQLIEVELFDKIKAVELLGREKDLFKQTTTVKHDVTENMAEYLLESKNRAAERLVGSDNPIEITGRTVK